MDNVCLKRLFAASLIPSVVRMTYLRKTMVHGLDMVEQHHDSFFVTEHQMKSRNRLQHARVYVVDLGHLSF